MSPSCGPGRPSNRACSIHDAPAGRGPRVRRLAHERLPRPSRTDANRMRIATSTVTVLGCLLCGGAWAPLLAQDGVASVAAFREQLAPFTDRVGAVLGRDEARFRATLDALVG